MGSVDCVKEIANSIDLFFKGLSDCGLLKTYKVQFLEKKLLDITSRLKFKIVVNEFLINMQKSVENDLVVDELVIPKDTRDSFPFMLVEELNVEDASTLTENDTVFILPQNVPFPTVPKMATQNKLPKTKDHYVERADNLINEDEIDTKKPVEKVLNIVYSNKEQNGITEPWQLSILENQAVDTTIDTITEVMTKNHMKDEGWQCNMCSKIFRKMQNLQEHCREEHNGTGCFECNLCGTRVMTKVSLKRHIRSHSGINSVDCDICHKTFKRSDYLAAHQKLHQGVRSHQCATCGKNFTSKTSLNLHEKVHLDQKNYICHQCNKSFIRRDKLRDHMLRHLNIKRFQCSVCNKKYAEKRDLRTHLKLHSNDVSSS